MTNQDPKFFKGDYDNSPLSESMYEHEEMASLGVLLAATVVNHVSLMGLNGDLSEVDPELVRGEDQETFLFTSDAWNAHYLTFQSFYDKVDASSALEAFSIVSDDEGRMSLVFSDRFLGFLRDEEGYENDFMAFLVLTAVIRIINGQNE